MSHNSKYGKKIKDLRILKQTLKKLGIPFRENVVVSNFERESIDAAVAFKLKGWRYDVSVLKDGTLVYDHWGSAHNTMQRLGQTVQAYNVAAVMDKANQHVSSAWKEKTKNGSVRIVMEY